MSKVLILLGIAVFFYINCCTGNVAKPKSKDEEGWTLISHRFNGNLNFFRNWTEYKEGFKDASGEFFLGLETIHEITSSETHELYIYLEDFEGQSRHALYDNFLVGSEEDKFKLEKIGNYSGDAGNTMFYNLGMKFTTYDEDNDFSRDNCAMHQLGGWWYTDCSYSNLFGLYLNGAHSDAFTKKGMYWRTWRGEKYSYKAMKMMVRPTGVN